MLTAVEYLILSLAAARITQFFVWDELSTPIRAKLDLWHVIKPQSRTRKFFLDLFSCPLCLGFWVSGATLAVWLLASGQWQASELWLYGISWWTVAMGQCLANFALDRLSPE